MRWFCIWFGVLGLFGVATVAAQPALSSEPAKRQLVVGVHDKPPFAFLEDGEWKGIGVDLWQMIADKLGYSFRFEPLPYEDLTKALVEKRVDVIVGEITVSAADEEIIDFSQPFLQTNVLVAVNSEHWRQDWIKIMMGAWDWSIIRVLIGVFFAMMIVAVIIWLVERHGKDGHFSGKSHQGLGSAMWFSVVTMSGVGYGDKIPQTFLGRFITIIWIFCGLLLMTAFTATVASTVATAQTRVAVTNMDTLKHQLNGVLSGGNAELLLRNEGAHVVKFESLETALAALNESKLDTVVGDGISLRYLLKESYPKRLHLLPVRLGLAHIAFGLPQGSDLREPINVALLQVLDSPQWEKLTNQYVGQSPQNVQ